MKSSEPSNNMEENKELAFCMPTYNRADVLIESIPALIEIAKEWQIPIYICDNKSTDNTAEVIQQLMLKYSSLYYFSNEENIGPENNTVRVLGLPDTKYRWLLGDHYKIKDRSTFRSVYDKLTSEECYDFIVVNAENRIQSIPSQTYTNKESVIIDLGWHMTMLSTLIYHKESLKKMDFDRFEGTRFSQTLSILEYISKKPFRIYWYEDEIIESYATHTSSTWLKNTCDIFIKNWYYGIMSLSPQYSHEAKKVCIRKHSDHSNLFNIKSMLLFSTLGGAKFSTIKNHASILPDTIGLRKTAILLTVSLIPQSILKISYSAYKKSQLIKNKKTHPIKVKKLNRIF
ncbi:glycosyltransferase family 2 protein [Crenobacter cavernae]|uniref:Glycosyltransferase family 2 protein n=1 Tax=Crenobacter cavernae TaxID=2290923 RepID=A0A345Y530_9NEIS|nr:glycosyltransferase [Crenobacter cavernae]AXK39032.1 glycosyltransferase family 2 protein [Crenobacter cavernae]